MGDNHARVGDFTNVRVDDRGRVYAHMLDTVKIFNPCGSAASVVHTGAIEERCVDNHARVCDSTNVACRRQRPCLRSYAHTLYVTTMVPSDVLPKAAIVNGDTPSSFCCLATSALSAASFLAAGLLSMGSQSMAKETRSWSINASFNWALHGLDHHGVLRIATAGAVFGGGHVWRGPCSANS